MNSLPLLKKLQFKIESNGLCLFSTSEQFMKAYSCLIGKIHFKDFVSIFGASVYLNFIIVQSDMPKFS